MSQNDDWNPDLGLPDEPEPTGPRCPSRVNDDVQLEGEMGTRSPFHLDGQFKGELHCSDTLTVGSKGRALGTLEAVNVVISGNVKGDVVARKRLEIQGGGKFYGELQVQPEVLVLSENAEFAREEPRKTKKKPGKVVEMPSTPKQPKKSS